jgi:endo-1,3(4)-beta-glucanase
VIYAAHAVVNPQEAYMYSSRLIDWGSGNSASNQLYFIATQSSTTDICTVAAQTPEGVYNIQDADSGLFITEEQYGQLTATTDADVLAGKFNLGFKPGGGTIQSLTSQKYVSASPSAEQPLSASRETPEGYETFRWNMQGDGTYTVTAMVNKANVSTGVDGKLINNVNSTQGVSGRYRITLADTAPPIVPPASGTIQSNSNNRFVISTAGAPNLLTTEASAATATRFAFARIPESDDDAPLYSIQNLVTMQYVTGNGEGTAPLSSTSPAPQAWEHFRLVGYQNAYILIHAVSGHAVSVQPDNTMIDDSTSITQGALWQITP